MSILKNKSVVIFFTFIQIFATNAQASFAAGATPPLTKCFIRVDNPHISNSIRKLKGYDAVKVNAVSICDKQIQDLLMIVEIRKIGFLRNHLVAKQNFSEDGIIRANKKVEHKGTWRQCENKRMSKYFGIAYSVAIIDGRKMQTLPVRTEEIVNLACGT